MRNSLELLATARVEHVYIKIIQFHAFVEFSVIPVHRKYSSEKKKKRTPREIRTSLFCHTSPGLSALYHSEQYGHIITIMIQSISDNLIYSRIFGENYR